MRATGSTSAKRGPDDPADGLHPVFHVPLGAGHEQERLGVGRHLLPLPGTTCKTERTGLLQAPGQTWGASPTGLSPAQHQVAFIPWGVRRPSLQKPFSSSCAFWFYICTSSYLAHLSLGPSWVSPLAFLVIFPYY